jgi:CheY-like chemotaxis protein
METYTALIVDDNYFNRDIFLISLESAGYATEQADDGSTALDILRERTFNLMILDLQMPGIDGHKVLEWVRQQPQHSMMRVVVVTANSHMVAGKVDELADHVMFKPVDVVDFTHFAQRLKKVFVPRTGGLKPQASSTAT